MFSFAFGLTLASYASAQVVSMVANPNLTASGSASASSPMSAPPAATSSSASMSSPSNQYNQYGGSSAPSYTSAPAQYTPPPQSEAMPYESFMKGGYQSMSCGYGYVKGSDGSCTSKESWVRASHLEISRAMQFMRSNHNSILPRAAIKCLSRPRSMPFFKMSRRPKSYSCILQLLSAAPNDCHQNYDGDADSDHDRHQDHDGDDDIGVFFLFKVCGANSNFAPYSPSRSPRRFTRR